jgi:predicted ATPase
MLRRLALAEDHTGALALYEQYVQRIKRERSSPLEPETEQLAERIRRGRRWKLPQTIAPRVPLFGRDHDLSAILSQWRETRKSQRLALVVLEAEPGFGKSRLAQEVAARVALDGGASVTTRAVSADRQQHLSGILSLVRGGLVDVPGTAATPPTALGALAHESSEWAERFPAAARAPSSQSLSGAVTEVLRVASAEQPLLLVFDDAQWLDDASLDQLEILVRDLARAPLLLLLTTTREPSSPRLAALRARIGRDVAGVVVTPEAFAEDDLRAVARWAIPSYSAEQINRLARRLLVDAAGIPLLAVEICRAVAQGMDVERMSGAWPKPLHTLDHTMPGDLPETIVGALRVGFNCLSAPAAGALKAAAVLGESERLPAARIGRGAHLEGAALDAALDELEWRSWLTADGQGYSFVARIVRDVVERDMVTEGERHRILSA